MLPAPFLSNIVARAPDQKTSPGLGKSQDGLDLHAQLHPGSAPSFVGPVQSEHEGPLSESY